MKKIYETPELLLTVTDDADIISTSGGDTPMVDVFNW